MRVGLTTTAIFGDLSDYLFGIFRDKASSISSRKSNVSALLYKGPNLTPPQSTYCIPHHRRLYYLRP